MREAIAIATVLLILAVSGTQAGAPREAKACGAPGVEGLPAMC
jgi:hypothetical protein